MHWAGAGPPEPEPEPELVVWPAAGAVPEPAAEPAADALPAPVAAPPATDYGFEQLPVALLELEPDGAVRTANAAARALLGPDAAGRHLGDLVEAPGRPMADWLAARVAGAPTAEAPRERMTFFVVVEELRRMSDDFALGFADDVANFTAFDVGTVIARDAAAGETVVADTPVYVVFPNAAVERGARAALLARPVTGSPTTDS